MLRPVAEQPGQVKSLGEGKWGKSRSRGFSGLSSSKVLWGGITFSGLFTLLIWALDFRLASIELLPDTGFSWYYWKLPVPTFWTRATSWGFYLAHQLAIWVIIYYAQTLRRHRYTNGLHRVNVWALAANAFFIFLHLIQTHFWYRFARTYHGYFFAWAIIYTFWYHPMVSTSGHLIGFFYMFLLLLQGSLFFTRIHTNRWWTFALEFTVLVHGTLVAVMQGNGLWPMFLFGFAGILVVTQMYGLGLSLPSRLLILGGYVGSALFVYGNVGWHRVNEIVRIPLIEYGSMFVLAGLFWLGLKIARTVRRPRHA